MTKKLLLVLSILLLVVVLAGCGDGLPKSAVAQVDDKVITREDLDRAVEELKVQYGDSLPASDSPEYAEMQKQVAERLVNEEILWFEAEKRDLTVTDDEINQQVDQYKEQSGGEEAFNQKLEENNLTIDRLMDQISKSLLFQKLYPEVTKDAEPVSDEQALKYYNENLTQFQQPEMRTVSHILVADEATASAVKSRLDAGEDFATVAKEVSTDPGSKDKGGDLGEVPVEGSGFVPEFETAMKTLSVGQISAPVKSSFGFHVIKVTAVKPAGTQSFEEVKEELKQGLVMENQRTAFEAWFESVKGDYKVEYAEEFKPTPTNTTPTAATTETQAAPVATPETQAAPVATP